MGQPEFGIVRILRLDPVQFRMLRLNPTFKKRENKTEVTSVKLVLFKYVMLFETLTKVDQLTEILRFG